jgi:cytosine/adenosine deaminase-related metal-dependent hydrolase
VLVAKQASSLAFLSGNRLGLGVGISPWPEDFAAMGVDWARRGKRMDECMDILRGLTSGEFFEYHGDFYDLDAGRLVEGARADVVVIDPAGLDDAILDYQEADFPAFGIRRMVNRNDDAVTATIIGGRVVFRAGTFESGFGEGWGAGRFLPARVADVAPRADVPSAVGAASGGARR